MTCDRCERRGQTWNGDAPRCGFDLDNVFQTDNWNCATLNALRNLAEDRTVWSEDQNAALIPYEGVFIVLTWYKSRGKTEGAFKMDGDEITNLTLELAEEVLDASNPAEHVPGKGVR